MPAGVNPQPGLWIFWEYERLSGAGVHFTQRPNEIGPVVAAVLDDTCGNLIQIVHQARFVHVYPRSARV
jgi:hypothetical protein